MNTRLILILISFIVLAACQSDSTSKAAPLPYKKISGKTMGTTYNITYGDSLKRDFKTSIDELLIAINMEVSTYEKASFISQFNQAEKTIILQDAQQDSPQYLHFENNFEKSKEIYKKTKGYFDPTLMPLVNYWGFGYTPKEKVEQADKEKIEKLRDLVGLDKITTKEEKHLFLEKPNSAMQLDFSAIAKGYGVDAVAELLEQKGIQNYLVEIGGEARAKGKNPKAKIWKLAISQPNENAAPTDFYSLIEIDNKGMASSGNYRNFHEVNGVKYGHTLNPKTGYPEINTLRSATVIAQYCTTADAFATAFMAMGLEKSLALAEQEKDIEAYFIYIKADGKLAHKYTKGTEKYLVTN